MRTWATPVPRSSATWAQDEQAQRFEITAQGGGGVVLRPEPVARRGHGCVRDMQGERVGAFRAASGQDEHPEPLGGDLGVGDTPLHERGGGAVAGPLRQPSLIIIALS